MSPTIVLGSSSKWRAELLRKKGNLEEFLQMDPNIDEKSFGGPRDGKSSDPSRICLSVARAKSGALQKRILEQEPHLASSGVILITSDQVVSCNGEIREKPESPQKVKEYMRSYCEGHPAETHTAVCVINTSTGVIKEGVDVARQYFHPIPESIIDQLIEKGDIMHCAGGFLIDDELLFPYLKDRIGDEDSIIGLPIKLTLQLIAQVS